jgi:metallo-beta-lactamase class B
MKAFVLLLFTCMYMTFCAAQKDTSVNYVYQSANLKIERFTTNTYIHISYLKYEGGRVPCNGLIYINKGEVIVFDTPTDNQASTELINWIQATLKTKIKAVVVNHSHTDCLGGLLVFHQNKIPSYSLKLTQQFAKKDKVTVPLNGFDNQLILTIGGAKIINRFFGEGHTRDNIVSYIPSEKIMFGGCLIKAMKADKGNLADANVKAWPETVKKVKKAYPEVKFVVPGHGVPGGAELLDYTIQLFGNFK